MFVTPSQGIGRGRAGRQYRAPDVAQGDLHWRLADEIFAEQFELASQGTHPELLPGGPDIVHLEHIIPQKIKTKLAKKQFGDWVSYLGKDAVNLHPRYVSRIGNLTLFAGELNISASNNPYRRKKKAHAQSAFTLTKTLPVKYSEFRFKQVEQRSKDLADLALSIWPAI